MRVLPGTSQSTIKGVEDKLDRAKENASGFTPGATRSTGTSRALSGEVQKQAGGSTAEYALSLAQRRRQAAQGGSDSVDNNTSTTPTRTAPTRGSQPGEPAPVPTRGSQSGKPAPQRDPNLSAPARGSQTGKPAATPTRGSQSGKPAPQRDPNLSAPARGSQSGKPAPKKDPKQFAQAAAKKVTETKKAESTAAKPAAKPPVKAAASTKASQPNKPADKKSEAKATLNKFIKKKATNKKAAIPASRGKR